MNSDFDATTAAWRELIFGLRRIHRGPCMKAAPEIKKFVAALEDICVQLANSKGVETFEGAMKALKAGFRRQDNIASNAKEKTKEHAERKKEERSANDVEVVLELKKRFLELGITTALTAPLVLKGLKMHGPPKPSENLSERRAREALKEIKKNVRDPG